MMRQREPDPEPVAGQPRPRRTALAHDPNRMLSLVTFAIILTTAWSR